jgi:hypothetical protein
LYVGIWILDFKIGKIEVIVVVILLLLFWEIKVVVVFMK